MSIFIFLAQGGMLVLFKCICMYYWQKKPDHVNVYTSIFSLRFAARIVSMHKNIYYDAQKNISIRLL